MAFEFALCRTSAHISAAGYSQHHTVYLFSQQGLGFSKILALTVRTKI